MNASSQHGSISQGSVGIMRPSTQFMWEKLMKQRHIPGVGRRICLARPALRDGLRHGLTHGLALGLALFACLVAMGVRAAGTPGSEPAAMGPQVTEGFINAPVAEVWSLFTTSAGYKATGVDQADVDLRIGGLIRTHYDSKGTLGGTLGDPETIVNEILAFEPQRMLAMRIKEPPASFPYREAVAGTWTVIYFTPAGQDMTQVRIVGLGYRDDDQSRAMRRFFEEGNRWTLDQLAKPYWPKCKLCEKE